MFLLKGHESVFESRHNIIVKGGRIYAQFVSESVYTGI